MVSITAVQRIETSGARAVEVFAVGGLDLLAIPQLALDVPDGPTGMNAGDSDTELMILRRVEGRFEPFAWLPAPGGEDAEFFEIGERSFLAVASIRSGSGPYLYSVPSVIFEWTGERFTEFQSISSHAAKQWRHWTIGERHFLGLAQGLDLPHIPGPNRDSVIYEWNGSRFVEFQVIPSTWAYNWHAFEIDGRPFVAHADHLGSSLLYRWDGHGYVPHQMLLENGGRAFADFVRDGARYLLVAGLTEPPQVLSWNDDRFRHHQTLEGLGARELCVVEYDGRLFVIRVNFILGTPQDPQPSLVSQVYEWQGDRLATVGEFPTSGGTDVAIVSTGPGIDFVVSNSLSPAVGFATETVVYHLATDRSDPLSVGAA